MFLYSVYLQISIQASDGRGKFDTAIVRVRVLRDVSLPFYVNLPGTANITEERLESAPTFFTVTARDTDKKVAFLRKLCHTKPSKKGN